MPLFKFTVTIFATLPYSYKEQTVSMRPQSKKKTEKIKIAYIPEKKTKHKNYRKRIVIDNCYPMISCAPSCFFIRGTSLMNVVPKKIQPNTKLSQLKKQQKGLIYNTVTHLSFPCSFFLTL